MSELCAACERVRKVCDRAEAQIFDEYKIKQGGHINTLQIRCAQANIIDPWENEILNQYMKEMDAIEKAMNDDSLSDVNFRLLVKDIINKTGVWAPKEY